MSGKITTRDLIKAGIIKKNQPYKMHIKVEGLGVQTAERTRFRECSDRTRGSYYITTLMLIAGGWLGKAPRRIYAHKDTKQLAIFIDGIATPITVTYPYHKKG